MRLGILTGDHGPSADDAPERYTPITGFQLRRIENHKKETGCPASTGNMGLLTAHCDNCGKDI